MDRLVERFEASAKDLHQLVLTSNWLVSENDRQVNELNELKNEFKAERDNLRSVLRSNGQETKDRESKDRDTDLLAMPPAMLEDMYQQMLNRMGERWVD